MRETIVRVTCDACGTEIEGDLIPYIYIGLQPMAEVATAEQLAEAEEAERTFDVCPSCRAKVYSLLYAEQVRSKLVSEANPEEETDEPEDEPEAEEADAPEEKPKKKKGGRQPTIDRGKVLALFNAGWPTKEIADEMRCSDWSVRKILKEMEVV